MNRLLLILWSLGPMLWQLYTSFRPNATLTGNCLLYTSPSPRDRG